MSEFWKTRTENTTIKEDPWRVFNINQVFDILSTGTGNTCSCKIISIANEKWWKAGVFLKKRKQMPT